MAIRYKMETMTTIPLEPIFENEKFNGLFPGAQYYVIKAIWLLLQKRKLDKLPTQLRPFFLCSISLWNKNRSVFIEIINEVAPEIIKIKHMKYNQSYKARMNSLENRANLKKQLKSGKLAEPIPENQAPLMPQFSALAATLHRERQLVQLPKPQHRQNERKPGLTEKPKV